MTVNTADVTALLMRLSGGMQASAANRFAKAETVTFASSLGEQLAANTDSSPSLATEGVMAPAPASQQSERSVVQKDISDPPCETSDSPVSQNFTIQPIVVEAAMPVAVMKSTKSPRSTDSDTRSIPDEVPKASRSHTSKKNQGDFDIASSDEGVSVLMAQASPPAPAVEAVVLPATPLLPAQAATSQTSSERPNASAVKVSDGTRGRPSGSQAAPSGPVTKGRDVISSGHRTAEDDASAEKQVKAGEPIPVARVDKRQSGETSTPLHTSGAVIRGIDSPVELAAAKSESSQLSRSATSVEASSVELRPRLAYDADRVASPTNTSSPTLEVGVSNGPHGWLKVRAELTDAGTVSAVLSPSSTSGEQMLHRELPALSNFLHSEQLQVSSLVVHQSSSTLFGGADAGSSGADAGSRGSGSGGQQQQETLPSQEVSGALDGLSEMLPAERSLAGGGWLSVRA